MMPSKEQEKLPPNDDATPLKDRLSTKHTVN